MDCPHCGQETSPTYLYCEKCGEQLELGLEGVRITMERDALKEAVEDAEKKARGALYFSIFFLLAVIAFRWVALRPFNPPIDEVAGYYAPYRLLEEKNLEPPASLEVKPMPNDIPNN